MNISLAPAGAAGRDVRTPHVGEIARGETGAARARWMGQ